MNREITLTIDQDMTLRATSVKAGFDGDNGFTRFVVTRPDFLKDLDCRVDFMCGSESSFIYTEDDAFLLPNSLTLSAQLFVQLVFTSKTDFVIGKTRILRLDIGESINAADETDVDFKSGLAILESKIDAMDVFITEQGEKMAAAVLAAETTFEQLAEDVERMENVISAVEATQEQLAEDAEALENAIDRANTISETLETKLANGELKGETGDVGPIGKTGNTGPQGKAATLEIGTVSTGEPGTNVIITNRGTENAAILDITIPVGENGRDGTNGTNGKDGTNGVNGKDGDNGVDGKHAYQYAIEGGYIGTEAQFYSDLAAMTGLTAVLASM